MKRGARAEDRLELGGVGVGTKGGDFDDEAELVDEGDDDGELKHGPGWVGGLGSRGVDGAARLRNDKLELEIERSLSSCASLAITIMWPAAYLPMICASENLLGHLVRK